MVDGENLPQRVSVLETQFENIDTHLQEIKDILQDTQNIRRERVDELRQKIDDLDDQYADQWVENSYRKLIAGILGVGATALISIAITLAEVNV